MLSNANPRVYEVKSKERSPTDEPLPFAAEVFDLIRCIKDPEHPHTLEELNVVREELITTTDDDSSTNPLSAPIIRVEFTPTVQHCSLATLIGLCIRTKLLRSLPERYKVDIFVEAGTHQSEADINKQVNDKERVSAALENPTLLLMVEQCIAEPE